VPIVCSLAHRAFRPRRGQSHWIVLSTAHPEIIAIGKGKILEDGKVRPLDVSVGDRILFGKYSGQTVKVQGEELLVMREEDIMGVVEGS
jgi:co-chaperonin GroES (HSP10)